MGKANERQVGGSHYQQAGAKKAGEQHWDRIWRLYGRGYFVGCITKYVERYHLKGGLQDLAKAQHYLEKLIELEKEEAENGPTRVDVAHNTKPETPCESSVTPAVVITTTNIAGRSAPTVRSGRGRKNTAHSATR